MSSEISPAPRPNRVLIVDDHPFFRDGIATWIGRQGNLEYCGWADTEKSAIAAIEQLNPDLVLLDLQLREGDGFEFLRALVDSKRTLRVIVLSQKDETLFAERVLRAGAHGYVSKDEASDTMTAAIETVLGGGIHVSPSLHQRLFGASGTEVKLLPDPLRSLFNRELEVFQLLGRGRTTKEIAQDMSISPKTVESYRENLKKKLGLPDSLSLVRVATLWQQQSRPPQ